MPKNKNEKSMHVVILSISYAEQNLSWLSRFVFHNEEKSTYFFSCRVVQACPTGMLEFQEVAMKANGETTDILLPLHAVAGVLLDQSHKNQFGFAYQEGCSEQ